jgi:hypothetical protein
VLIGFSYEMIFVSYEITLISYELAKVSYEIIDDPHNAPASIDPRAGQARGQAWLPDLKGAWY